MSFKDYDDLSLMYHNISFKMFKKFLRCEMREIRIVQITYRRQVLLDSDLGF